MVLGAIVIIVTGVLVINYFDGKKGETTSIETEESLILPTNHTISEGEDLWKIAEMYYGSGYNWIDIANENNIQNPDQINVGTELTIPDVQPRLASANDITPTSVPEIVLTPVLTDQEVEPQEGEFVHVVSSGESLWKIAEKYYQSGYNWVDIAKKNDIATGVDIEIGQQLVIPSVEAKDPTTHLADEETRPISNDTYTVVKGDSLWDIALRTYGDGYRWIDIARENNLANPDLIHQGNVLTLPR
jgi:nucleoid-associated protein YgaU